MVLVGKRGGGGTASENPRSWERKKQTGKKRIETKTAKEGKERDLKEIAGTKFSAGPRERGVER